MQNKSRGLTVLAMALGVSTGAISNDDARQEAAASSSNPIASNCTFEGRKLNGKVEIVDSYPDFKVETVSSYADLHVKFVESYPDDCGEWQVVDSYPDFKVQFVSSYGDFKIKVVDSYPGVQ